MSDRVHAMVRFSGELSTKAKRTRGRFQKRLARNLRDAFEAEGVEAKLHTEWSRFYIEAPDDGFEGPLGRTFGVSSHSRVLATCEADLDQIIALGTELFAERVKGKTYAVRARRSSTPGISSGDVQQKLGAALNPGATVDLGSPEVSVNVEMRDGTAYFYGESVAGADGLPLGVQGKALALISGGFDSSVAAWMALRRGVTLDYVFCNLGGTAYQRMVVEVTKVLSDHWSYGTRPRLHVLDFGPVVDAMRERAKPAYLQVVLKRMFYRAAARIADEVGAQAIVTGESIGQVSSQTLTNLTAIEDASSVPVLRPLLGLHKGEIIDYCREIGTYDISSRIREYCEVSPAKPVTAASREDATAQELAVGHEELDESIAARQVLDLRRIRPEEMAGAALYVTEVPEGAMVIDTRPAAAFEAWHWPGSIRRNLEDVEAGYPDLDRTETYVLLCAEGIRTAYVAELMQRDGYEAYSFLGGAPRLRRTVGATVL